MANEFRQLETLFQIEQNKEKTYATDLSSAQSFYQSNVQKLKEVESYKLDYLKQLQQRGSDGLAGGNYMHFQRFIVQLDEGIAAQNNAVDVAKQVVEQRRNIWLEQRAKTQAVESVLNAKKAKKQLYMNKLEQAENDEFALQKFVRDGV